MRRQVKRFKENAPKFSQRDKPLSTPSFHHCSTINSLHHLQLQFKTVVGFGLRSAAVWMTQTGEKQQELSEKKLLNEEWSMS